MNTAPETFSGLLEFFWQIWIQFKFNGYNFHFLSFIYRRQAQRSDST